MEAPQDDEPSTAPEETPEDVAEGEQGEETPEAVEENKKSMSKDVEEDGGTRSSLSSSSANLACITWLRFLKCCT